MNELPYNPRLQSSILEHGRKLLGHSLHDLYPGAFTQSAGKGRMGNEVERLHFRYNPNSNAEPDFAQAGLELKCTPLKETADGSLVAKERLVLNLINYVEEVEKVFETSSFWTKNRSLLLMFYLHQQNKSVLDLIFKIIRTWEFPAEDLKIIIDDWNKIHAKILSGEAHNLSEGDTLYLAACQKGSRSGAEMRDQPYSHIKAQQRAYSLKQRYVNQIILDSLLREETHQGLQLSPKQIAAIERTRENSENAVKSINEYLEGETFEELIIRRFEPFRGLNVHQISEKTGIKITCNPKAIGPSAARAMLGVKSGYITEFEKANIQMKTIRIEHNGRLKESMVFDKIDYRNLSKEDYWEESELYRILSQRFLFIIFRKKKGGNDSDAVFEKAIFWTMPACDLDTSGKVWLDTRDKVREATYNNFIRSSHDMICHVRPKAKNARDMTETPQGGFAPKKAFWLNRKYILEILDIVQSNEGNASVSGDTAS